MLKNCAAHALFLPLTMCLPPRCTVLRVQQTIGRVARPSHICVPCACLPCWCKRITTPSCPPAPCQRWRRSAAPPPYGSRARAGMWVFLAAGAGPALAMCCLPWSGSGCCSSKRAVFLNALALLLLPAGFAGHAMLGHGFSAQARKRDSAAAGGAQAISARLYIAQRTVDACQLRSIQGA